MMTPPDHLYEVRDHHGERHLTRAKTRREAIVRVAVKTAWTSDADIARVAYWSVQDLGLAREADNDFMARVGREKETNKQER